MTSWRRRGNWRFSCLCLRLIENYRRTILQIIIFTTHLLEVLQCTSPQPHLEFGPLMELLQRLKTFLEMRNRFPTIVLVPIPFPFDQVLHPPSSWS